MISLKERSRNIELFKENFASNMHNVYPYLEKDENSFSGRFIRYPDRDEIPIEIEDQLVVEFYSRLV